MRYANETRTRQGGTGLLRRFTAVSTAFVLLLFVAPTGAAGQDIVERGRPHGVRPPDAMLQELQRNPDAYQLQRAWKSIAREVREQRRALYEAGRIDLLNAHFVNGMASQSVASSMQTAVTGTLRMPVLVAYFADSTHTYQPSISALQSTLFGTSTNPYTITSYYSDISSGLVTMTGDAYGWFKTDSTSVWYEGASNGDHVRDLVRELVRKADAAGFDFSQYDRDGDGYVDLLGVLQPLVGGECSTTHIWSHSWAISPPEPTNDGVSVYDYIIQPAIGGPGGCDGSQIMPIGTFAHELGHGIDLPDLYDRTPQSNPDGWGIGVWGLMAYGGSNRSTSPAHMMAWSKDQLGWVAVDTALGGSVAASRTLQPVENVPTILRLDAVSSDEYFLLEVRQPIGSDQHLRGTGLLIWHVDEQLFGISRNDDPPYGIALEQADGLEQLENDLSPGDADDPFPGNTGNTAFAQSTTPNSRLHSGENSWIRVTGIVENGDGSVSFTSQSVAPDLVVEAIPFDVVPDTIYPGGLVDGPPWTIRNIGTGASGSFRAALYLSPDSLITVDDDQTDLFATIRNSNIDAGADTTIVNSIWKVPEGYAAGTYYVGMLVDDSSYVEETDETNNYISRRIHVGQPDLVFADDPFPLVSNTGAPGDTITGGAWTIRNAGTANSGGFANGIYLSADSLITTADDRLTGNGNISLVPGGEYVWGASKWILPDTLSDGTYFVGILLDDNGASFETDETNNFVSARITVTDLPDGTIVLKAGPDPNADVIPGGNLAVPILADMSSAGGLDLASMTFEVNWDPARLTFDTATAGDFGTLTLITTDTATGMLTAGVSNPTGTTADFTALNLSLTAGATEGATQVTLNVTVAGNETGQDITSALTERNLSVCVGLGGFWGDVTSDDNVNIIDAQQIARYSVGLPVADPDRFLTHGDVTADGNVNIIDAQQIARHSVGLPTSGRTGDPVGGGC